MVNLFGKSRFGKSLLGLERSVSKRKASSRHANLNLWSDVESLESRQVLTVNVTFTGGSLYLTANAGDDPTITFGAGATNVQLTTATYVGNTSGFFLVTGNIYLTMDGGDNAVTLTGAGIFAGDVTINLGDGANSVTVSGTPTVRDLKVSGGIGAETETIDGLTARNVILNNGSGNSTVDVGTLTVAPVSATGAFSITNTSSAGGQATTFGTTATVTVATGLTINQGAATTHGVTLTNTNVTAGGVLIINGTGTGDTTVDLSNVDATGDLKVINGNVSGGGSDNSVNLDTGSLIGGNVAIQNGTAGQFNTIAVDGSTLGAVGRTHTLTNQSSTNSTVNIGTAVANTVTGALVVSNNSTVGTLNNITVNRGSFTGSVSLTNSSLGATANSNNINVGTAGGAITYNGNWTITNNRSLAGGNNTAGVSNLIVAGGGAGNVKITNETTGVAGANNIRLGEFGANTIAGSVTTTNYASAARRTVIDQTTVNGTAGVSIYHSGSGNSQIDLGFNTASVDITAGNLTISDAGTGTNALALRAEDLHVAGNFTYSSSGGADDTLSIGLNPSLNPAVNPPRVRILGNTVINTGAGNDIVNIAGNAGATTGDAAFVGQLRVVLGSGTDVLTVASVQSNLLVGVLRAPLTNFLFDGGAGVDIWRIAVAPGVYPGIQDPDGFFIDTLTEYMQKRLLSFEGPNIVN